jgi:hypothetical protein
MEIHVLAEVMEITSRIPGPTVAGPMAGVLQGPLKVPVTGPVTGPLKMPVTGPLKVPVAVGPRKVPEPARPQKALIGGKLQTLLSAPIRMKTLKSTLMYQEMKRKIQWRMSLVAMAFLI